MRSLSSYLLVMFAVMFWGYRLIGTAAVSMGQNLGFEIINITYEIALLFVTLLALVLIVKRKLFGGLLYFGTYIIYFGTDIYNNITNNDMLSAFWDGIGVLLAILVLFDILLNKTREANRKTMIEKWTKEQIKIIIEQCKGAKNEY